MGIEKRIANCAALKINEAPCGQILNVDLRQTSAVQEGLISNISNVFPDCDLIELAAINESLVSNARSPIANGCRFQAGALGTDTLADGGDIIRNDNVG